MRTVAKQESLTYSALSEHLKRLAFNRGRPFYAISIANWEGFTVPPGLVISDEPQAEWWTHVHMITPLRPAEGQKGDEARKIVDRYRKIFGSTNILFIVAPHINSISNSTAVGPVVEEDLNRTPQELLDRAKMAFKQKNFEYQDSLALAYLAVTGRPMPVR